MPLLYRISVDRVIDDSLEVVRTLADLLEHPRVVLIEASRNSTTPTLDLAQSARIDAMRDAPSRGRSCRSHTAGRPPRLHGSGRASWCCAGAHSAAALPTYFRPTLAAILEAMTVG